MSENYSVLWLGTSFNPALLPPKGTVIQEGGIPLSRAVTGIGDCQFLLNTFEKNGWKALEESEFKITADYLVYAKLQLLVTKLTRRHHTTLLNGSRQFALNRERSWYFCQISLDSWLNIHSQLAIVKCSMSAGVWGHEACVEALEMLYNMDPEREYMLSFEVYRNDNKKTVFSTAVIVTHAPTEKETEYERMCKVDFKVILYGTQSKLAFKWVCISCCRTVVGAKHLVCGKCKIQRYCSPNCQRADWKTHKYCCNLLLKLREQRDQPTQKSKK